MIVNDAHCHFFSTGFFEALARQAGAADATATIARLGWDAPGSPEVLATRWRDELDRYEVQRAALIASVPGDEISVSEAIRLHPDRFAGMFMLDPTVPGAPARVRTAIGELGLTGVCLFPAMHHYSLRDPSVATVVETLARASTRRPVRSLRRVVDRRPQETRSAERLRREARQSPRFAAAGARRAVASHHHSALRRGVPARDVDAGRSRPERARRHVQLERVDPLSPGSDVDGTSSVRRWRCSARIGFSSAPTRRSFRAAGRKRSCMRRLRRLQSSSCPMKTRQRSWPGTSNESSGEPGYSPT